MMMLLLVMVGVVRVATLTECPLYAKHSVKRLIGIASFISSNKRGRVTINGCENQGSEELMGSAQGHMASRQS